MSEPTYLSRTCVFGACMTCGQEVTETATEWFTRDEAGKEEYIGVTHPACPMTPEAAEKGHNQNKGVIYVETEGFGEITLEEAHQQYIRSYLALEDGLQYLYPNGPVGYWMVEGSANEVKSLTQVAITHCWTE